VRRGEKGSFFQPIVFCESFSNVGRGGSGSFCDSNQPFGRKKRPFFSRGGGGEIVEERDLFSWDRSPTRKFIEGLLSKLRNRGPTFLETTREKCYRLEGVLSKQLQIPTVIRKQDSFAANEKGERRLAISREER